MGLDAVVFCDCVEKGRLRIPHPFPGLLYIDDRGAPEIRSKSEQRIELHDAWMQSSPCRHETLMIAGGYLGNIALISYINRTIRDSAPGAERRFPVLMLKVIFSGSHTGDHLEVKDVRILKKEIAEVQRLNFRRGGTPDPRQISNFLSKLAKIVDASMRIKKPIAF